MRYLIIHNLSSGPCSNEIMDFIHALGDFGDEIVLRYLGDSAEPEQITKDANSFDRIVVSGGDGTVSNVICQLKGCDVPILIFPSGTANLLFNNIGNSSEPASLAKACQAGKYASVDLGELMWQDESGENQSHTFSIIAGSGFDATIMKKAENLKSDFGELAYFIAALGTPSPTVTHFTIEHDGVVDECDGIGILAANTSRIQGDISIIPGSSMVDGVLDIAIVAPIKTVRLLPTVIAGILDPEGHSLGRPQMKIFKTTEAKITCEPALDIQYDGEVISHPNNTFCVRADKNCIKVIVDDFAQLKPENV